MPPQGVGIDNPAGPPPTYTTKLQREEIVNVQDDSSMKNQDGYCRKFTNNINRVLETIFEKIGFTVATHPWKTILISLLMAGICMVGVIEYEVENRGDKLWVSQSSDSLKHKNWVEEKFPVQSRPCAVMLHESNGNVLTPEGLVALYNLNEKVKEVEKGKPGTNWEDICFRSNGVCISNSILELWHYNLTKIRNLTKNEILDAVNQKNLKSPMTQKLMNVKLLIGGPVTMENNRIVKATAARINIKIKKQTEFVKSKGKLVDEKGEQWEESFSGVMKGFPTPGYTLYYFSEWGRTDAASGASQDDLQFFAIGYILVIIYLALMLGSFSRLGHKIYLAMAGIGVIGLSVGIAYGLGSAFQLKKTAVHDVLAFLLLGIGVDDVFVIVQNWENIGGPKPDGRTIPEKISLTLKHAGVSILVTSLTDVCAFMIGASTILPALRSFCIWSGIGILAVFLLTITFFTAWLAIDAKRQHKRKDALLCCITLSDSWEPIKCSEKSYLQLFVGKFYGPTLMTIPGKVISLLVVVGLLAGGAYGLSELEQDFDFDWFMPQSSSPRQFQINVKKFFPSSGISSSVYTGAMNYSSDYKAMDTIKYKLESDSSVAKGTVNSWYHQYHHWLNTSAYHNELIRTKECNESVIACKLPTDERFYELLHKFLNSTSGAFYRKDIRFSADQKSVEAASIPFTHVVFDSASKEIAAMDSVQEHIKPGLVATEDNSLLPFVHTFQYVSWETNKVISKELFRNVLLATLCVFIVTLFLLSNLWASFMVVLCVALALIDIAGYMHFWGLTIDTVTTIIMVIAIGLTVDYSAHIAHGFMVSRKASKNERMIDALGEIGPAVIHGGISTVLAFLLLAASESYVFFTFFKVFFLTVMFGMFHGLVFLPVILSLLGPAPYAVHEGSERKPAVRNSVDRPAKLEKMTHNGETFIVEEPKSNKGFSPE